MTLRGDLALISNLINPNARVLDLGGRNGDHLPVAQRGPGCRQSHEV